MDWSYLSRRGLLPLSFQPIPKEKVPKARRDLVAREIAQGEYIPSSSLKREGFYLRGEELFLIRLEPSEQVWFELLVYYCLAKENHPLSKATLYFPLYSKMHTYDLSQWQKEEEFRRDYNYFHSNEEEVERRNFQEEYGYHLVKEKVKGGFYREFPFPQQIFLTSPQGRVKIQREDLEKIKNSRSPAPLFVHGRYLYNLCNRGDKWLIEAIKEELAAAEFIGALGVVVHTGKRKELTWEEGVEAMFSNIEEIVNVLPSSSPPLILETCAKQGTEILGDLEEFLDFYARLDREKVKICLDSCHVFAAGYDPLLFLERVEERFPGSTILVHFNDSARERGCRVDRHQRPGLGFIGYKRMKALYDYCREKRIPLLHE